jgi:23S rRNA pseudouridine2605 synthase
VICTQRDERGFDRPRAVDLIGPIGRRVYCVGRLDEDTTGLIILTNDGELTDRLTHPRYGVMKTYIARVAGRMEAKDVTAMRRGVLLNGRGTSRAAVKVLRRGGRESLLELKISEGRNRQVRRILARLGHNVRRLHRSGIGPVTDSGLKIGKFRHLSASEVGALRKAAGM